MSGGDFVTAVFRATEHCESCEEDFTREQLERFDPADNDHCPACGERGAMTTLYGEDRGEGRLQSHQLEAMAERVIDGDLRARVVARLRARATTEQITADRALDAGAIGPSAIATARVEVLREMADEIERA